MIDADRWQRKDAILADLKSGVSSAIFPRLENQFSFASSCFTFDSLSSCFRSSCGRSCVAPASASSCFPFLSFRLTEGSSEEVAAVGNGGIGKDNSFSRDCCVLTIRDMLDKALCISEMISS